MNSMTVILFLVGWMIRSTVLAALAGVIVRRANAHRQLTAWTGILVSTLLLPVAGVLCPPLAIPFGAERALTLPDAFGLRLPVQTNTSGGGGSMSLGWSDVAVIVWLAVALVFLLRLAIGIRFADRLRRQSTPVLDGVFESAQLQVPVTVGIIRPVVILPADWRGWPAEKLSAVLAHERSHAERRDPLRQFAASVLQSIAWFHPLTWWLRATLVHLAEAASDDAALSAGADRVEYARTLLHFLAKAHLRVEGVAMASRSTRSRRMDRILDDTRQLSRPMSERAKAFVSLAAIGLTLAIAALRPVRAFAGPQAAAPGTCAARLPYSQWLSQDVVYIIENRELEVFSKLTASAECDHFIDQFWARRDPTPNTPENEFKDEHYRRIGYANTRFRGWQTDRGHIYILYGPPDEIESHPSGGTAHKEPYEAWMYRRLQGVGTNVIVEFVDRTGNGDYRMTLDPSPDKAKQRW